MDQRQCQIGHYQDFYALWYLATHFDFDGLLLFGDADRIKQWKAFWERSGLSEKSVVSLEECVSLLGVFLLPPLQTVRDQAGYDSLWRHERLNWERNITN